MAAALSHSLQTRQCLPGSGRRECQFGAEEIPLILSLTFDLGFWRAFHVPESFRTLLEHWKRLVDRNPGQFIFEEDRFLRRK